MAAKAEERLQTDLIRGEVGIGPARIRIATAMVNLVADRGYRETTLELVLREARVDQAEFERHFRDLEDCYIQLWDEVALEFRRRAVAAFEEAEGWREGIRAVAWETGRFLSEDPTRTRFAVLESLWAGEVAEARCEVLLQDFIELIDRGRYELDDPDSVPRVAAEVAAGAIYEAILKAARNGEFEVGGGDLIKMTRELMYLTVLPYLGAAAAQEELLGTTSLAA